MGTAMTCGDVASILIIDHDVALPAMMVGSDSQEPVSVERSAAAALLRTHVRRIVLAMPATRGLSGRVVGLRVFPDNAEVQPWRRGVLALLAQRTLDQERHQRLHVVGIVEGVDVDAEQGGQDAEGG
jgi:hypothetical protein